MESKSNENPLWIYYQNETVRQQIDDLLKKNAALESSLGKDSTVKERVKIKLIQERLFEKIKDLDPDLYKRINPHNDED